MQDVTGLSGLANNRITLPGAAAADLGAISPNNNGEMSSVTGRVEFSAVLEQALDHVSGMQDTATEMQTKIELGISDDLVGTMVASQKASLAFQGVIQARNRVVSAYETVFNMPV